MKRFPIVLVLVLAATAAFAQTKSPVVKASMVIHRDGTRTVTITRPGSSTLESQLQSSSGNVMRKTISKMMADGRASSSQTVDSRGRVLWTERYDYGDAGQILGLRRFRPDGTLLFRTEVTVDSQGTSKVSKVYDAKGKPIPQAQWSEYLR